MKDKLNKELVLQVSIILACLIILAINFTIISANAQISCDNEPPLANPTYPQKKAWLPGTSISVEIFDTPDSLDFEKIDNGIRDWNDGNSTNCSNVTFNQATSANRPFNSNEYVPDEKMYVRRERSNGPVRSGRLDRLLRQIGTPQESVRAAIMVINESLTHTTTGSLELRRLSAHETGHSLGLANGSFSVVPNRTIMAGADHITTCDNEAVRKVYCPMPTPTPTPVVITNECDPRCQLNSPEKNISIDDLHDSIEPYDCCRHSPIVVDILGNGFDLTNVAGGVMFDFNGDGVPHRISWTSANSDDAWLVFDRNGSNTIDSSLEMFGNYTEQPASDEKNGFLALAEYDKTENGGNDDGVIDSQDNIFNSLRLWQDTNHNGISETSELKTLPTLNIVKMELRYNKSKKTDANGNEFRYRTKVWDSHGAQVGRWAWDVFLKLKE